MSDQCDWCTPNGTTGVLCCAKELGHDGPHATVYALHPDGRPDAPGIAWMDAAESDRWIERGRSAYVRNQPAPRSGT